MYTREFVIIIIEITVKRRRKDSRKMGISDEEIDLTGVSRVGQSTVTQRFRVPICFMHKREVLERPEWPPVSK